MAPLQAQDKIADHGGEPGLPAGDDGVRRVLDPAVREQIATALARAQIGDAIERQMFLAALDYQLAALAGRLPQASPDLLAGACRGAVHGLDEALAAEVERLCVGFIGALARTFDDCFETAPTADPDGPFLGVLARLHALCGLPLTLDPERLRQLIGCGDPVGPMGQPPRA